MSSNESFHTHSFGGGKIWYAMPVVRRGIAKNSPAAMTFASHEEAIRQRLLEIRLFKKPKLDAFAIHAPQDPLNCRLGLFALLIKQLALQRTQFNCLSHYFLPLLFETLKSNSKEFSVMGQNQLPPQHFEELLIAKISEIQQIMTPPCMMASAAHCRRTATTTDNNDDCENCCEDEEDKYESAGMSILVDDDEDEDGGPEGEQPPPVNKEVDKKLYPMFVKGRNAIASAAGGTATTSTPIKKSRHYSVCEEDNDAQAPDVTTANCRESNGSDDDNDDDDSIGLSGHEFTANDAYSQSADNFTQTQ